MFPDLVVQAQLLRYLKFELLVFLCHFYHPMGYYGLPYPRVFKPVTQYMQDSLRLLPDLGNGGLKLVVLFDGDIVYGCVSEFRVQHEHYIRFNDHILDTQAGGGLILGNGIF